MTRIFLRILSMTVSTSWTILFVMAARAVLYRFPKRNTYLLWAAVAFRMCCPFSLSSLYSLQPSAVAAPVRVIAQVAANGQDFTGNEMLFSDLPAADSSDQWNWTVFLAAVWAVGVCLLILYGMFQSWRFARRLRSLEPAAITGLSVPAVYLPDGTHSTFLFGIFRPRIYLPKGLSEKEREYILAHELSHLRRGDHIAKPLFWLLVCVHWINPLAWLAFYLFEMDMEKSCDERVILHMAGETPDAGLLTKAKKEYSSVLLKLSSKRFFSGGQLLALGENCVKGRIRGILRYKKTKLWISAVAVLIVAAICIGLAFNPSAGEEAGYRRSLDFKVDEKNTVLSIDISLPDKLSLSVVPADAPIPTVFYVMNGEETVGTLTAYPYAAENAEDLQAVDTASENLPMQIYATIALSNHVDYSNEYIVAASTETASSAVCRALIHEIENYAGHTPDAPWAEHDCVLAYDLAAKPYFIVLQFDVDVISHQQLVDIAKSIVFFHD